MPPAVGAAVATGIAGLGAAKLASNSNAKAAKTSERSTAQALAYQKAKDEQDRKDALEARDFERAQIAKREAQQAPLLALKAALAKKTAERVGLPVDSLAGLSGASAMPSSGSPATPPYGGGSLAALAGMRSPVQPEELAQDPPAGLTIADIIAGKWGARAD